LGRLQSKGAWNMKIRMQQPVKVVVEHDLAKSIMEILKREDKRRVMVVLDQFLMGVPAVQEMIAEIQRNSMEVAIYSEIVPDPPASVINKGAESMKNFGADCVIAIGGGSCLDSAKGIDIVASNGGSRDILDYVKDESLIRDFKCLISVPTTAGTGSEISNALVVTDETPMRRTLSYRTAF
jgi:alcohol dehydrogenase class IV